MLTLLKLQSALFYTTQITCENTAQKRHICWPASMRLSKCLYMSPAEYKHLDKTTKSELRKERKKDWFSLHTSLCVTSSACKSSAENGFWVSYMRLSDFTWGKLFLHTAHKHLWPPSHIPWISTCLCNTRSQEGLRNVSPWCQFCTRKNKHFLAAYRLLFSKAQTLPLLPLYAVKTSWNCCEMSACSEAKLKSGLITSILLKNPILKYMEERYGEFHPFKGIPACVCLLVSHAKPQASPGWSVEQERHQAASGNTAGAGGERSCNTTLWFY